MSLRTSCIYFLAVILAFSGCTHFSWQQTKKETSSVNIPDRWPSSNDQTGEDDEESGDEEQEFSVNRAEPQEAPRAIARRSTATVEQYDEMNIENLLEIFDTHSITQLDQLPPVLPHKLMSNFQLKSGINVDGPRGHKHEVDVPGMGIHAESLAPRVYIFDPKTGFALSYNGGRSANGSPIQGGHSLDIFEYNESDHSFNLQKIDFHGPNNTIPLGGARAAMNNDSCVSCHGPSNRPIFSMYPDWPRFYGSDNDELLLGVTTDAEGRPINLREDVNCAAKYTNDAFMSLLRCETQKVERRDFLSFKAGPAQSNPRYSPLFSPEAYQYNLVPADVRENNFDVASAPEYFYEQYPYRSTVEQDSSVDASNESRAFTRRAGLRFNLLYSRLLVRNVIHKMTNHPNFDDYGMFFVYNIARCGPQSTKRVGDRDVEKTPEEKTAVMNRWRPVILRELQRVDAQNRIEYHVWDESSASKLRSIDYNVAANGVELKAGGAQLQYGQNLALFDLKINDVDMRFTYYHPAYDPNNAFRELCSNKAACLSKTMDVGYLEGGFYNSYNDGSTTMDEHLSAQILLKLAETDEEIRNLMYRNGRHNPLLARGLLDKYGGPTFRERMRYDTEFFTLMDGYSKWFSIPYAESVKDLHHRAGFNLYREGYNNVCRTLERKLLTRPLPN